MAVVCNPEAHNFKLRPASIYTTAKLAHAVPTVCRLFDGSFGVVYDLGDQFSSDIFHKATPNKQQIYHGVEETTDSFIFPGSLNLTTKIGDTLGQPDFESVLQSRVVGPKGNLVLWPQLGIPTEQTRYSKPP